MSCSVLIDQLFPRQPENGDAEAARAREVDSIFPIPPEGIFIGADLETGIAVNEARLAYMHGLWLSTILTAIAAIGRSLAAVLSKDGEEHTADMPFWALAERAEALGHISSYERAKFHELYDLKTGYTRFRGAAPMVERLEEAGTRGVGFNELLQDDARMALTLAAEYFSRRYR